MTPFTAGIPVIETDKIEARRLFASKTTAAVQIVLKPGAEVEKHVTEEDVFFYILEGTPTITVAEESRVVEKETLVECAGGVLKGMVNSGTVVAKVLVVKMTT